MYQFSGHVEALNFRSLKTNSCIRPIPQSKFKETHCNILNVICTYSALSFLHLHLFWSNMILISMHWIEWTYLSINTILSVSLLWFYLERTCNLTIRNVWNLFLSFVYLSLSMTKSRARRFFRRATTKKLKDTVWSVTPGMIVTSVILIQMNIWLDNYRKRTVYLGKLGGEGNIIGCVIVE